MISGDEAIEKCKMQSAKFKMKNEKEPTRNAEPPFFKGGQGGLGNFMVPPTLGMHE
jgi:hypothetical protein